jgi:hypothetical protein
MCDPLTAAAAAASAGGAFINSRESANTQTAMVNARNAATTQELGRQKVYGDESRGFFDNSLKMFSPESQTERLQAGQAGDTAAYKSNIPTDVGSITTTKAPALVGASEQGKVADVFTGLGQSAERRGALTGYDTAGRENKFGLNDNARRIDTVGDFSKVSAGVNRSEQDAAYKNAYRPNSGIGDLLSFAGQVGGYQAGKGGGLPFMNMFSSTPTAGFTGSAFGAGGNTLPFGGPR